eukprot:scaffold517_cov392-Prasinococcus_capsulatus_cf.AAC.8
MLEHFGGLSLVKVPSIQAFAKNATEPCLAEVKQVTTMYTANICESIFGNAGEREKVTRRIASACNIQAPLPLRGCMNPNRRPLLMMFHNNEDVLAVEESLFTMMTSFFEESVVRLAPQPVLVNGKILNNEGPFCSTMRKVMEADLLLIPLGEISPYAAFMRPSTLLVEILPYPLHQSCTKSLLPNQVACPLLDMDTSPYIGFTNAVLAGAVQAHPNRHAKDMRRE